VPGSRQKGGKDRRRGTNLIWLARLFLLFLAVTSCVTAGALLYGRWRMGQQRAAIQIDGGDPDLGVAERLYLQTFLVARAEALVAPAGRNGGQPVNFVVAPGESAEEIAANLVAEGVIDDRPLFLNYLRYYGLDSELEAGTFRLEPGVSIPDLALQLSQAHAQAVTLRFVEGWRVEEMGAYLAQTTAAEIEADAFLAIASRQLPFDLSPYDFLAGHPPGASLEGFLFPDTYQVPLDADAADLVAMMLRNFGERLRPAVRRGFTAQGLTIREGVTLASIVERETPLAEERPLVAGVFLNRLDTETLLQADPTVQYAVGYDPVGGEWWKSPLSQADLELDSPYNTYLYEGLPPGPIANPSLASLEAVAAPASTDYLFFVADCGAEGAHLFAVSYTEHVANVEKCR